MIWKKFPDMTTWNSLKVLVEPDIPLTWKNSIFYFLGEEHKKLDDEIFNPLSNVVGISKYKPIRFAKFYLNDLNAIFYLPWRYCYQQLEEDDTNNHYMFNFSLTNKDFELPALLVKNISQKIKRKFISLKVQDSNDERELQKQLKIKAEVEGFPSKVYPEFKNEFLKLCSKFDIKIQMHNDSYDSSENEMRLFWRDRETSVAATDLFE